MKDRVPGVPGQYQASLSSEALRKMQAGEPFHIIMTRDDQPIVEGTPYSKAAVLPDKLANTLCPDISDPTPADAFAALSNGKAPTGYGIGSASMKIDADNFDNDLNNAITGGIYYYESNAKNLPTGMTSGTLFVKRFGNVICFQNIECYRYTKSDGYSYKTSIKRIGIKNSIGEWDFTEWEFENPPMDVGVEYRTTERWNGATKYTRQVAIGELPYTGNKVVSIGVPSHKIVTIDIYGFDTNPDSKSRQKFPLTKNGAIIADAFVNSLGELVIESYANNMYWEAYAVITYEK